MAILTGPAAPTEIALVQLARSQRQEPFGLEVSVGPGTYNPVEVAIMQLVKLMNRLMGLVESMAQPRPLPVEDDFMKGWGEPGGPMEP